MSKPTYSGSDGTRYTTSQIDRLTKESKGYTIMNTEGCCERCESNDGRLTCSHIVSVKYAKESGHAELCWCKKNIELLCTKCHLEVESWSASERMDFYKQRKL